RLTSGELRRRANRMARHLRRAGVGPEARVGICTCRSIDAIVGMLGALKAGGAYVPLDPSYPPDRLAFMIDDADLTVLVTQGDLSPAPHRDGLPVVRLDADRTAIEAESDEAPDSGSVADNLAYVIYTSGSTGKPRGVGVSHRGIVRLVRGTDY